ncbi:restriction endonuclease subunit S [Pseudoalteromonas piscicida]|uniref:restriction endonuclease subunit S n=1 Tax=Pseudoalteromonas piscicida TaxID=43662 RepID=UPI00273A57E1|nr:restriction endonuclease subunit S [Pseudoalteromonas piscicida]MDP4490370.1 restriction endonuclease subunit S [Pseudoalteromonas piscicida]
MSTIGQVVPDGYKQTEVGIIPNDWSVMTIGDIANVKTGPFGSALHEKDYVNDGTPIITVEHLGEKGITYQNLPMVSDADKLRLKAYQLFEGDIVFSRVGSIDRNALVTKDESGWLFSGRLLRVKLKLKNQNPSFFSHQFHTEPFKARVREVAVGQTMPSLNTEILKNILVVVPKHHEEQTAIANALSDVDALLTELEKLIAKKQAIKTATMQQLLTGKTRLPQFATYSEGTLEGKNQGQPKGTKPSELGEIPEDWDVVSLRDVITFKNGAAHEDCIDEYGNFVLVNSKFISTEGKVRKGTNECRQATIKNDLLMVMSDVPNGKAIAKCFLVDQDNLYTVNQRICILRPNEEINPTFLLKIVSRNPYYLAFDDGAKQTNLRREDVLNCPIVNPSFEEQTAIATILSNMDNEIKTLEQRLAKTRQIKQGMMQALLTGRIRLPFNQAKGI